MLQFRLRRLDTLAAPGLGWLFLWRASPSTPPGSVSSWFEPCLRLGFFVTGYALLSDTYVALDTADHIDANGKRGVLGVRFKV